jgi:CelD/BcsL family acetyltransferase involved in cellulose biosynthesis
MAAALERAAGVTTIEEIRTHEAFSSLRPEWDALHARVATATPFDTHAWYSCCLAADRDRPPAALAARAGGVLVGIAPFREGTLRVRGIRARSVGFIANRETPRCGFLIHPDHRDETLDAVFRHLRDAWRGRWDVLALNQWPEDAPDLAAASARAAAAGFRFHRGRASVVPTIEIRGSWDEFLATKSYLFRKSRRGVLNRMARVHDVTIERVRRSDGSSLLESLVHVSRLGWKHPEGLSLAGRADSIRCFEALTLAASREGWLDVWILRVGGAPVAFEYGLTDGGTIHALRAEYDAAHERISPGAYLEYFLLKTAFDEGCSAYSCGPGLDAYKLRWTETLRENAAMRAYAPTPKGRFLEWLEERAVPWLRRRRAGLRPRTETATDADATAGAP